MDQTPAHEQHNSLLLSLMPPDARTVVEVGCSSGALAREYKRINGNCRYLGVEVMSQYAPLARRFCDRVHELDIEAVDDAFLRQSLPGDCWVFADVLEHLIDPWALLKRLRGVMPADGCVVACIPNAQHWSVQARLNCGIFRYEEMGLLDRTHLRWFTRITVIEMFQQAGFKIVRAIPKILSEPLREKIIPAIKTMAIAIGADPEVAAADATVFQHIVRAVPC
jgi:cyclopropane fatty-acyl-phospholipid synthase-like methyltransferase